MAIPLGWRKRPALFLPRVSWGDASLVARSSTVGEPGVERSITCAAVVPISVVDFAVRSERTAKSTLGLTKRSNLPILKSILPAFRRGACVGRNGGVYFFRSES